MGRCSDSGGIGSSGGIGISGSGSIDVGIGISGSSGDIGGDTCRHARVYRGCRLP